MSTKDDNKVVITFGTFDLFHEGHLNILKRAKALGDRLVVGVSSDAFNFRKKQCYPVYNETARVNIVRAIRYVDDVFVERSLELKALYLKQWNASVLVMGDDWKDKFDDMREICEVVYLPRTQGISSTEVKSTIRSSTD